MRALTIGGVLSAMICAGCASVRLPLCPAIAHNTYQDSNVKSPIGKLVAEAAEIRNIKITPLSWFAAEFHGAYWSANWMNRNYQYLVCGFDPSKQNTYIRETYLSCMAHSKEWIGIIQSGAPENLMLAETKFFENCAQPK